MTPRLEFLGVPVRVAITPRATCRDAHTMAKSICAPYRDPTTDTGHTEGGAKVGGSEATGGKSEAKEGGNEATGGTDTSGWDEYTLLVLNLYCHDVKREVPKDSDELLNLAWSEVLFIAWNIEG